MSAGASEFFSFPTAVLQAGHTYGPHVTPQIGVAATAYTLTIQQMGTWPPGNCLELIIERSQDGGLTWPETPDCTVVYDGGTWTDRQGNIVTSATLTVSIGTLTPDTAPQVLSTAITDLFRVTVQCLQSCSALIKMGSL